MSSYQGNIKFTVCCIFTLHFLLGFIDVVSWQWGKLTLLWLSLSSPSRLAGQGQATKTANPSKFTQMSCLKAAPTCQTLQ